jgi:hypothetical protein
MYSLLCLSCHAKWVHGKNEEAVLKCPVRMRFQNVVLYSKGDGMLCLPLYMNKIGIPLIQHSSHFSLFIMATMKLCQFNFSFGQVVIIKRTVKTCD